MKQPALFDDADTLPIFSGTPARAQAPQPYDKDRPASLQLSLSSCRICHDTGSVTIHTRKCTTQVYCSCAAGIKLARTQSGWRSTSAGL